MYYFCKGESRSLKVKKQKTLKTIFSNKLKKFSRKKTYDALWSPFLSSLNVNLYYYSTPDPQPPSHYSKFSKKSPNKNKNVS